MRVAHDAGGEGTQQRHRGLLSLSLTRTFGSQALGKAKLAARAKDGGPRHFYRISKEGPGPSLCPFAGLSVLPFSSRTMHSVVLRAGCRVQWLRA